MNKWVVTTIESHAAVAHFAPILNEMIVLSTMTLSIHEGANHPQIVSVDFFLKLEGDGQ